MGKKLRVCGYCGGATVQWEKEHVIPDCLYPQSKRKPTLQLLTIVSCHKCNASWQDAEVHARNVCSLVAGTNPLTSELADAFHRSLDQKDGLRRMIDISKQIKLRRTSRGPALTFMPDKDEKFMLVVRKVIRGLCHHHKFFPFVPDSQVWVRTLTQTLPPTLFEGEAVHHRELDVLRYRIREVSVPKAHNDLHSVWCLTFFDALNFWGVVAKTAAGFRYSGFGSITMHAKPPLRCRYRYKDRRSEARRVSSRSSV